jgi:hypothetical protein
MGHRVRQLLATFYVALSLILIALGGSEPTRWVLPSYLELWQTHDNCGAHFRYGCYIPLA